MTGLTRRGLLALSAGLAPGLARAAGPLTPIRISAATAIPHAYNGYMIAGAAPGLYEGLGLKPEYLWAGGSATALQLVLSGDADIANVSFLDFIAAKQKQPRLPARMVYCQDYASSYVLIVPERSPIQTLADFKGKSVGVANIASGAVRSTQAMLRQAGIGADAAELVAVGPDASAMAALRSGKVDALNLFIGAVAILENLGMRFRQFVADYPCDGFAVSERALASNRDLLIGGLRGIALSTAVSQYDPRAAAQAYYALYGAPTGDKAVALAHDAHTVARTMDYFKHLDDQRQWGELTAADWRRLVEFAGPDSGITMENTPIGSVFDGSLIAAVNQIDIAQARAAAQKLVIGL